MNLDFIGKALANPFGLIMKAGAKRKTVRASVIKRSPQLPKGVSVERLREMGPLNETELDLLKSLLTQKKLHRDLGTGKLDADSAAKLKELQDRVAIAEADSYQRNKKTRSATRSADKVVAQPKGDKTRSNKSAAEIEAEVVAQATGNSKSANARASRLSSKNAKTAAATAALVQSMPINQKNVLVQQAAENDAAVVEDAEAQGKKMDNDDYDDEYLEFLNIPLNEEPEMNEEPEKKGRRHRRRRIESFAQSPVILHKDDVTNVWKWAPKDERGVKIKQDIIDAYKRRLRHSECRGLSAEKCGELPNLCKMTNGTVRSFCRKRSNKRINYQTAGFAYTRDITRSRRRK